MARSNRSKEDWSQSSLEIYLREINKTPLLTAQQEKELAYRIENGDGEARDQMARANLRLVVNIARSYAGRGLSLHDLIEEGNLGLLRAVEGFDPSMNTRFSTYASYWIKQSIKRALVNTAKTIRIPAYMVELLVKWRRASAKLQTDLGRPPSHEEIAKVLRLPKKQLAIIKKAIQVFTANPAEPDEEGYSMDEVFIDERSRPADSHLQDSDNRQYILSLLKHLDEREATVLRMRFGLDAQEPKTLKEIGEHLGLTRERVRQIETDALSKLSQTLQPDL